MDFDISKFKRNSNKIKSYLTVKDDMVITNKRLYIMFPEKFVDKGLSVLSSTCYITGLFAIIDDDGNYSVSKVPTRMSVQPAEIDTVLVNDVPYVVLEIEENTDLIASTTLIKENIAFPVYDLFFIQGKIPWYYTYEDIPEIFKNMRKYAGSKSGDNIITYEFLTAIIARDPNNLEVPIREIIKSLEEANPKYVGLKNPWFTFKSTLSKVAGAYMKLGLVAAMIHPEKEVSDLESVIRE